MKYPRCAACSGEINPRRYDDCQRYYLVQGEALCHACFVSHETAFLEQDTTQYAALVGAHVVHLMEETT